MEEPRLGLLLGSELLQHEPDPEQHGGQQGGRIVHIQVHGALFSLVRKCAGIKDNAQY